MARVYISSTYEDLVAERQAAIGAVEHLRMTPVSMETYGASEERPIERCLADIRSCQAYVGIIGLRYGSIARGRDSKSYTELEYDEAGRCGVPRFLYLCPDAGDGPPRPRDPDSRRIDALRATLRERHVVEGFTDPLSLRLAIARDLGRTLKPEPANLRVLPTLCDRVPQRSALSRALQNAMSVNNTRPQICVVQGDEYQCLDGFVVRMRREMLPRLLQLSRDRDDVLRIDLPWPTASDADGFDAQLRRFLVEETVGGTDDSLDAVSTWIARRRQPVLIHMPLRTDAWSRSTEAIVERFIDTFASWILPRLAYPVVVVFKVSYRVEVEG